MWKAVYFSFYPGSGVKKCLFWSSLSLSLSLSLFLSRLKLVSKLQLRQQFEAIIGVGFAGHTLPSRGTTNKKSYQRHHITATPATATTLCYTI